MLCLEFVILVSLILERFLFRSAHTYVGVYVRVMTGHRHLSYRVYVRTCGCIRKILVLNFFLNLTKNLNFKTKVVSFQVRYTA